jgi:hypothetical protein
VIERPDDGAGKRRREHFETLVQVGVSVAGVVIALAAYLVSRLTPATLGQVVQRLIVGGVGVLAGTLLVLALRAPRSHALNGRKLVELLFATALPMGSLVALQYVDGWTGAITLGGLVPSAIVWTWRILRYIEEATPAETPTRAESSLAGALGRLGRSLWRLGNPFVLLGRTFALGATVTLCVFLISGLFVSLTTIQTGLIAVRKLASGTEKRQDNDKVVSKKSGVKGAGAQKGKKRKPTGGGQTPPVPRPQPVTPPVAPRPDDQQRSWSDVCGTGAKLPGYDRPPLEAAEFQRLFYGLGQPGADGTGCTGKTGVVPGHPEIHYLIGVNSAGDAQSIAIVWQDAYGSYDGAIVIAPATDVFWELVLRYGRVHSIWRVNAGNGDLVVIWTTVGTTVLIRATKTDADGGVTPYTRLDPPASDLWMTAVERTREWLWPLPTSAQRGKRAFSLVHDPVLRHEVTGFSYDKKMTMGSQIALKRIERYAPAP